MLRTLRSLCLTSLTAAFFSVAVAPAFADSISLVFTQARQSANAGTTVSFNATISAPTTNSTLYDLSDNFDFDRSAASLTIDDSGFFNNFLFTDFYPGTSQTALLFTVALPANLAAGAYTGFFEVFDSSSNSIDAAVKSTATFEIDVPGPGTSPVPEPSTWLLLATGLTLGLGAFSLRSDRTHGIRSI